MDAGRPPVDVVVRKGRVLRGRRHIVVAAAAVAAIAVPLGVAWLPGTSANGDPAPSAAAPTGTAPTGAEPDGGPEPGGDDDVGAAPESDGGGPARAEVVAEREPVDVGHGLRLGLLVGPEPRYAVAPESQLEQALLDPPVAPPEPLGVEMVPAPDGPGVVVAGAVLDPAQPGEIRVTADGQEHSARLVRLAGDAGWGCTPWSSRPPRPTACCGCVGWTRMGG